MRGKTMEFCRNGIWIPCSIIMACPVYHIISYVHNGVSYTARVAHSLVR